MNLFFKDTLTFLSQHRIKVMLTLLNVILGVLGVWLSLTGRLPLDLVHFSFFSFLFFLAALYRPAWVFLLLIGLLPYEIIPVAPIEWGIFLRPYQWLMCLLLGALTLRALVRRPAIPGLILTWYDALPILVFLGSTLAALGSDTPGESLKLTLIVATFVALFFTVRLFVRTENAALSLVPFVGSSFGVVVIWSLTQNILFALGKENFEVMAGRPNGLFSEADWLGMYLLLPLAAALAWLYRAAILHKRQIDWMWPLGVLFVGTILILISMTRSAWIGFFAMSCFFAFSVGLSFWKLGEPKRALLLLGQVLLVVFLAWGTVPLLHLSRFAIFDRAVSTSGKQKITVACQEAHRAPSVIRTVEELQASGCEHIQLEERAARLAAGQSVQEIERDDPNVSIRQSVYQQAMRLIGAHPWQGIGFGNIGKELGTDGRGASLNSSNMWLELWLGSGLLGLLAFAILWGALGFESGKRTLSGQGSVVGFALFFHLGWIGLTLFNLFNAGILLGFFFAFLGLGGVFFHESRAGKTPESN